jgi:regulator of replication initiation timing
MKGNYIDKILDRWDENETIMNLAQEIKRLQLENGKLTSYLSELEHKDSVKNYKKLEKQLSDCRSLKGTYKSKLGQLIDITQI